MILIYYQAKNLYLCMNWFLANINNERHGYKN